MNFGFKNFRKAIAGAGIAAALLAAQNAKAEEVPYRLLEWNVNAAELCVSINKPHSIKLKNADQQQMAEIIAILQKSPTMRALMAEIAGEDIYACALSKPGRDGLFRIIYGLVEIAKTQSLAEAVATTVHELRHAWQDKYKFMSYAAVAPEEAFLLLRALEADAEAFATHVSYELKEAGYADALDKQAEHKGYGDIARAYIAARVKGESADKALRIAYDQWFEFLPRYAEYDDLALEFLTGQAHDGRAAAGIVTEDFLQKLGAVPGIGNYMEATGPVACRDYITFMDNWHIAGLKTLIENVKPIGKPYRIPNCTPHNP